MGANTKKELEYITLYSMIKYKYKNFKQKLKYTCHYKHWCQISLLLGRKKYIRWEDGRGKIMAPLSTS